MKIFFPFRSHFKVYTPSYEKKSGVDAKSYSLSGEIFAGIKTFGGTETEKNGVLVTVDTAVLHTWYTPILKSNSRLQADDGSFWDVITPPEDLDQAHRYIAVKVQKVEGGA